MLFFGSQCPFFCLVELNEVLDRLKQGPSQSPQRVETSDTSGDETDASQGRRKVRSRKTYRMKKVYAATELGRFFVTGATDAANMPTTFTVGCAGKTCPCSPMGTMKCCGIIRGVVTLLATSACALRHLGGAYWIFKEIH